MTDEERELDLLLGEALYDLARLRAQLEAAKEENITLRHTLLHIHAKTTLALAPTGVITHDDKDSY
tara:strand:- start:10016 stop:10213 length:198 start_codon:yes stop_codon:yes gene_type:complete